MAKKQTVKQSRESEDFGVSNAAGKLSFQLPILEWSQLLEPYGDLNRLLIINPTVASVLAHFASSPIKEITPLTLLQSSFNWRFQDTETLRGIESWSEDPSNARHIYPKVAGKLLWDLGCGEGALGRWLDQLGARYLGVDANPDYIKYAKKKAPKTAQSQLICSTIKDFLENVAEDAEKPTLITLLNVLLDPELDGEIIASIAEFLKIRRWYDVPLLITTFDPDYFSPCMPSTKISYATLKLGQSVKNIPVVDPAIWEMNFADRDLFVLEQRPYQLHRIPAILQNEIVRKRMSEVLQRSNESYTSPPRHGPFYFWLLSAKKGRPAGSHHDLPCQESNLDSGDTVELTANLPARVYEIISGKITLKRRSRDYMIFKAQQIFGQLEMGQNYFASRQIGTMTAREATNLKSIRTALIKELPDWRNGLPSRLLTSLLGHYETLAFDELINTTRQSSREISQPLGKNKRNSVINCAAALLHLCSQERSTDTTQFTSRVMLQVTIKQLESVIFGATQDPTNDDVPRTRSNDLIEVLLDFHAAGIIDCYSTSGVCQHLHKGLERYDLEHDLFSLEHFGLWVLQFLHCALPSDYLKELEIDAVFDLPCKTAPDDHFRLAALSAAAISAMLGWHVDRQALVNIGTVKSPLGMDNPRNRAHPAAPFNEYVQEIFFPTEGKAGAYSEVVTKLEKFFGILKEQFSYVGKSVTSMQTGGLSSFIYVRDVWALLACAFDDDRLWKNYERKIEDNDIRYSRTERFRREAYFKECIRHVGALSGLYPQTLVEAQMGGADLFDESQVM